MERLLTKLAMEHRLSKAEFTALIYMKGDKKLKKTLFEMARETAQSVFGRGIYIRGLIEISNYCKNDCFYCGIRRGNGDCTRFRLSGEDILACCETGHRLGFRTFVMQGGEDGYFTDEILTEIISEIKRRFPDSAITLSLGERSRESYEKLFEAGADRYLLRHETASPSHYGLLHPQTMSHKNRIDCLKDLKAIGYQFGMGFMVGAPYQTPENLAEDMCLIGQLRPHMVGIGLFIPHHSTPFAQQPPGSAEDTLFMLALLRLMLPKALLPATTALGTIAGDGRQRGILAGANVVMPNLSPQAAREKYTLYDNKLHSGAECAEALFMLKGQLDEIGYHISDSRGDSPLINNNCNDAKREQEK